jgi:TatD DNase family protein
VLVDTHVHFDLVEKDASLIDVLQRAKDAGVERVMAVGGSLDGNIRALSLAAAHSSYIFAAVGFDRCCVGQTVPMPDLEIAARTGPAVVALGEMGLDYHYSPGTRQAQIELFGRMLDLARKLLLPIIVHSREADADTFDLVGEHARLWKGDPDRVGVLHCFTGTEEFAKRLLGIGMSLSFSGILSFRNADSLRAVARMVPARQLLIETDSPYLAPVPYRGKANEPANVRRVAEVLAEVRKQDFDAVASVTTENAVRLFGLPNLQND